MTHLKHLVASAVLALVGAQAHAVALNFDFGDLKWDGSRNTGFLPTSSSYKCTNGDLCSSDVNNNRYGGGLTYTQQDVSLTATGSYRGHAAAVVQDHDNSYTPGGKNGAGLGVYHTKYTSDDNVTFGEVLTLTFNQDVTISNVGLRSETHDVWNWTKGATLLVNGKEMLLPKGTGDLGVNLTGRTFTFAFNDRCGDQFYLSSLAVQAVPEPASAAMLLAGLGLVGGIARRRRQPRGA